MKRKVIIIDENICNGCGSCVNSCHEGALELIDGKAQVVNETFCDGLGACIGECPLGAIKIEEHDIENDTPDSEDICKCPGSMEMSFKNSDDSNTDKTELCSQLSQWPVQLYLVNPQASYFKDADVVLAADCSAYVYGNFHNNFIKNRSIAIACPKLDSWKDEYIEKIKSMINTSKINTLTVVMIEVPCCEGLLLLAQEAVKNSNRKIPIKKVIIGIKGDVLKEEWV
jgi:NAD-dependent dihydropyrimidine dehydrogenase PreA subunit